MNIEHKYCNKCGTTKESSFFGKCSRNSDGLQSWCKGCKSFNGKANKPISEDGTMTLRIPISIYNGLSSLCCVSCNKVKSKVEFYIDTGKIPPTKCKHCTKYYMTVKYNTDESYRNLVRSRQKHTPERKKYNTDYHRERYHIDFEFRLTKNIRTRIAQFVSKDKKLGSSEELLGCDGIYLKEHLKSKFKDGMSFKNYGKVWEIDHIKPCASFDLTKDSEQRECFHYTNLQPLFTTTEIAIKNGHMNEIGNRNKQHKLI